jgi:hypothetical protein
MPSSADGISQNVVASSRHVEFLRSCRDHTRSSRRRGTCLLLDTQEVDMKYIKRSRDEHLAVDGQPNRILALR